MRFREFAARGFLAAAVGALLLNATGCSGGSGHDVRAASASPAVAAQSASVGPSATSTTSPRLAVDDTIASFPPAGAAGTYVAAGSDGVVATVITSVGSRLRRLTTFDLATGQRLATFDGTDLVQTLCGMLPVRRSDQQSILLGIKALRTPAQGIQAGGTRFDLVALSARAGRELWRAPLVSVADPNASLCTAMVADSSLLGGGLEDFTTTSDGRYGVSTISDPPTLVDLVTGKTRQVPNASVAVGSWVTVWKGDRAIPSQVQLLDAATLAVRGTFNRNDRDRTVDQLTRAGSTSGSAVLGDTLASSSGQRDELAQGRVLPGAQRRWVVTRSALPAGTAWGNEFATEAKANVFLSFSRAYGAKGLTAIDADTGRLRWSVPTVEAYCGATDGRVFVLANGQYAVLDAQTGTQVGYDTGRHACPTVRPGMVVDTHDSSGSVFARLVKQ